jgi:hypothetical protein
MEVNVMSRTSDMTVGDLKKALEKVDDSKWVIAIWDEGDTSRLVDVYLWCEVSDNPQDSPCELQFEV